MLNGRRKLRKPGQLRRQRLRLGLQVAPAAVLLDLGALAVLGRPLQLGQAGLGGFGVGVDLGRTGLELLQLPPQGGLPPLQVRFLPWAR